MRITLRGLSKTLLSPVRQALPLNPDILLDLVLFLNLEKRVDRVFWGILVVGFFTFFRKSNLIPDTIHTFDPRKQPSRGSIRFEKGVALVKVTWTKTIQTRGRCVEVPLFPIPGSALCPVNTIRALLQLPGKSRHPLFSLDKGVPFTYYKFLKKFKKVLDQAGYDSKLFSGHSTRRGGVQFAFRSGVPEVLLKTQGDWTSDCYKRYLSFPVEVRAIVNLKMKHAIQNRIIQ